MLIKTGNLKCTLLQIKARYAVHRSKQSPRLLCLGIYFVRDTLKQSVRI